MKVGWSEFATSVNMAITWVSHRLAILVDLALLWLFGPLLLPSVQRPASAAPSRGLWRVVPPTASATHCRWEIGLVCLTLVTVVFALVLCQISIGG